MHICTMHMKRKKAIYLCIVNSVLWFFFASSNSKFLILNHFTIDRPLCDYHFLIKSMFNDDFVAILGGRRIVADSFSFIRQFGVGCISILLCVIKYDIWWVCSQCYSADVLILLLWPLSLFYFKVKTIRSSIKTFTEFQLKENLDGRKKLISIVYEFKFFCLCHRLHWSKLQNSAYLRCSTSFWKQQPAFSIFLIIFFFIWQEKLS